MFKGLLFTLLLTLSLIFSFTDVINVTSFTNIINVTNAHAQDTDLGIALIETAKNGNLEEVKTLIKNGADVNATAEYGYTALSEASFGGHLETVKFLVENGADINFISGDEGYGGTPLLFAADEGHLEIVKYLMDKGADVNIFYYVTPLHLASDNGNLEIVKILIENGADINILDEGGSTALMYALDSGHEEIINYLKKIEIAVNGDPQDK